MRIHTLYIAAMVAAMNFLTACKPQVIATEKVTEKTIEKIVYSCPDGTKLETDTCPPVSPVVERYVQCQDESIVKSGEACPTPVPETVFVCASNGQTVTDNTQCPIVTVECPEGDAPFIHDGVNTGCLQTTTCHEGWGYVPPTASTPASCKKFCPAGETINVGGNDCVPVPVPDDGQNNCPIGQNLNGGRCYVAGPTWPLEIQEAGDSPRSQIILGNSSGVHAASFKMRSGVARAAWVRDISFSLCPKSTLGYMTRYECGEEMIQAVHLMSDDGLTVIATAIPSGAGLVHFHGLYYSIYDSTWTNLRVTVDVKNITQQKDAGSQVQINVVGTLVEDAEFGTVAVGNVDENREAIVTESNTHTLHRSKPTVSLASGSPSGAAIPGFSEVLRFNVSADQKGYVTLKELLFKVNSTDNDGEGSVGGDWNEGERFAQASKWKLYDLNDPSMPIAYAANLAFRAANGNPASGTDDVRYVQMWFEQSVEIWAGGTRTFVLMVDTSDASAANDDSIRIDIPDEVEASGVGLNALLWNDDGIQSDFDGSLIKNLYVPGGTQVF